MLDFNNPEYFTHVITNKGKLLEVPLRRGREDGAFVDYLTFTFDKTALHDRMALNFAYFNGIEDEVYIHYASELLNEIFGFGITEKRQGKGKFFYNAYYQLGSKEVNYGTVHIGGQRNTILVDLTGVGCQAALIGWEQRLFNFGSIAERFSISRVDVAADFFNGEYTPLMALSDYKKGLFDVHGMRPKYKLEGTDWFNDDNTGKTLYIGRRGSSKFCRVYEKGKQLGDVESQWVRFEIEFRKNDVLILPEILVKAGQYLAGAYEVGKKLFKSAACRLVASERKAETTLDEKIYYGRNQVGKLIRYLFDSGWSFEQIGLSLIAEEGKYPDGLKPLEYDCQAKQVSYEHDKPLYRFDFFDDVNLLSRLKDMLIERKVNEDVLKQLDEDIQSFTFERHLMAQTDQLDETKLLKRIDEIYIKYQPFLD